MLLVDEGTQTNPANILIRFWQPGGHGRTHAQL